VSSISTFVAHNLYFCIFVFSSLQVVENATPSFASVNLFAVLPYFFATQPGFCMHHLQTLEKDPSSAI